MKDEYRLSFSELLNLESLIAFAEERGLSFSDRFDKTQEQAEAQAELHEAMWEAHHGGMQFSDHDRMILGQMRELASQLEFSPTLGQLIELREAALRGQGPG
jgi:hypothetical protein